MSEAAPDLKGQQWEVRQWEVRTPLVYGSRHEKFFATEDQARGYAERLSEDKYGNSGLQIHTRSKTIYINEDES